VTGLWYDGGFGSGSDYVLSILFGSDSDTTEIFRIGSSNFNIRTTLLQIRHCFAGKGFADAIQAA